jgi:hypothetical protein
MPSIRMGDVTDNPDVHYAEVQTESQWKFFSRNIREGLNVVVHDNYYWHRYRGIKNPIRSCFLYERIKRKFEPWKGAKLYAFHHKSGDLWITLRLPDHSCLDCDKKIRPSWLRCKSCGNRLWYRNQPFHPELEEIHYSATTNTLEFAYRLLLNLRPTEKLVIDHVNCSTPRRCLHMRFLLMKEIGSALPYSLKIVDTVSQVIHRIS